MADLTAKSRNALPDSAFALAGRRYPIENASHARNALARVSQNGTPEEQSQIRSALHRSYPDIDQGAQPENRKRVVAAMIGKK